MLKLEELNALLEVVGTQPRAHLIEVLGWMLDDGKLVVPKEIGSLDVKILDEKNKIRSLTGTVPSTSGNTTGKSKMILRGKDGEILLYR